MWIKDHYHRLINTENVMYLEYADKNAEKKVDTKLWTIAAHIKQRDRSVETTGVTCWLTEGFTDKKEVIIRMNKIAEGIANGAALITLD